MKKLKWVNRIVSLALIVVVGLSSIGIENHIVWANEADIVTEEQEGINSEVNMQENQDLSTGYVDIGHVAPRLEENDGLPLTKATVIPEQYSSVEKGYVTSVKNQSQWGLCWAFAACAAMESYVLSHGMVDNADEVDFCEYALAYLTFQDTSTQEETGDYTLASDMEACFDGGGNDEYAFKTLSKGAGIYNESLYIDSEDEKCTYYEYSVENSEIVDYIADEENKDFVLSGQYYISIKDTDQIKAAVMENGAVIIRTYLDAAYSVDNYSYIYNYESTRIDHNVVIVGWDDSISKELFSITKDGITYMPKNDGAWLVKNSWGTYFGDGGYSWISYEDKSVGNAVVYELAPKELFDNIYQHDGGTVFLSSLEGEKFASVYQINGESRQKMEAVSFAVVSSVNRKYTVNIYRNTEENTLDKGEMVATKSGRTTHEGYYTVLLDEPVEVNAGEVYTVELIFDEATGILSVPYYSYYLGGGGATVFANFERGQSYYSRDTEYRDSASDLCIKLFTANMDDGEIGIPQINSASLIAADQAAIAWRSVENAESYDLWIGTSKTDENAKIVRVSDNYYVDDVSLGNTYYYKVKANFVDGSGSISSEYSLLKRLEAEPIVGLDATRNGNVISLNWNGLDYVDGYRVYRSTETKENVLIADIANEDGDTSYEDVVQCGQFYEYYIVSYMVMENGELYEAKSNCESVYLEVPRVYDVTIDDNYYGKMIFEWTACGSMVDGYEIYAYSDEQCVNKIGYADVKGGEQSSYTFDTSGYGVESKVYYEMFAYVENENGDRVLSNEYYEPIGPLMTVSHSGDTEGVVKDKPLDVELKWYVRSGWNLVLLVKEKTQEDLCIWREHWAWEDEWIQEKVINNYDMVEKSYSYNDFYFLEKSFDFYVTDGDKTTALQEQAHAIGGAYVEPTLEPIEDIQLSNDVHTIQLKAIIKNPMENFDYRYQWYVADSENGTAIAIEGANESTYEVSLGTHEKKYYYCTVTCEYYSIYTYDTTNGNGGRTCVSGKMADINVLDISDQIYTGKGVTPKIVIKDEMLNKVLIEGTDYTLTFSNNVNVGVASVTITFRGDYTGAVTKTFSIVAKSIENMAISNIATQTYTGSAITPSVTVKDGNTTLVKDKDYTVSYSNNVNVGTATVTITGKGNYTGTKTVNFTIEKKEEPKPSVPSKITSSIVNVNESLRYISKITIGTTIQKFRSSLNETDYVKVYKDNQAISDSVVLATGMQACLMNGNTITKKYSIIVTGDVNGDGKINITDMIAIKANILKKSTLSGVFEKAGDVNGDGKINVTDFIKIKATLLKKDTIVGVAVK